MRKSNKLFFLAIATLILAACGGAASEPVSLTIDLTEYAFNPPDLQLKVGQEVTLTLTNSGQLQHEIMFGRNVMKMANRPAGYQEDMFAAGGVTPEVTQDIMPEEMEERHAGFMVLVPVGGTATMKFKVTEGMVGEWEMGCFEQDGVHYDAGMKGQVLVTK